MVKRVYTDAEILRHVRKRIAGRRSNMICFALDRVRIGTVEQKTSLKRWIEKMLDGYLTYGAWLHAHHREFSAPLMGKGNTGRLPGRLAWLDWMIEQCEKEKGNG